VVADLETEPRGDFALPLLDRGVREFLDPSAVVADDVVVVLSLVELEDRRAALEVMAGHESRRLELGQHAIDGGQADVLVGLEQPAIDVLGTHVPGRIDGQDLQDLEPRHRDLQAGSTQLRGFHVFPEVRRPRPWRGCAMMRGHYVRHAPATPDA